ncbi:MAG: hypothetical protein KGI04_01160 [Candidatus Micrarchaeota archaeon]|nr:hypothetical protein [Candidatus Micrarchaeota archaeon]
MRGIPGIDRIEKTLVAQQKAKDRVQELSRDVIRLAGKTITQMHAGRMREAQASMKRLASLEKMLRRAEKGFEYFSTQAHQEYVEASTFYIIIREHRLASAAELHAGEVPYLLGIMDLTGELKREITDAVRSRNMRSADTYYGFMKGIYDSTRGMRFADSLVPEFRRKQDAARIQLEGAAELLARASA